jgi:hypothetical protein
MRPVLYILISIAFATLIAGCSDESPVEVNFDTGPVMSISIPAGFRVQSHKLEPWVLLALSDDGRSISMQAAVPGDKGWVGIGKLTTLYYDLLGHAMRINVDDRRWVLIPAHGVVAYSISEDIRFVLIASGDWKTQDVMKIIRSIKVRTQQDKS